MFVSINNIGNYLFMNLHRNVAFNNTVSFNITAIPCKLNCDKSFECFNLLKSS